ncbi:MAG: hypothetical protein E7627_00325 [Ruminococcaceae bacterium]|nr:hypothetical protein [Oscillospiraceae bacterium]
MTSTKILVDKKRYSSLPYFKFYLKQNWQQFVLFLIIALFVILLPSYVMLQNEVDWIYRAEYDAYGYDLSQEDIIERTQNNMRDVSIIGLLVSGGLAVISGMSAMAYVNSKKSVGCYHSFPIRRESMFVIETSTPAIYFILSIVAANLLSYLMFLLSVDGAAQYTSKFFLIMLSGILLYFFIYTAFLLAGGLTGTHVMKFLMLLIILFLPVAVYVISTTLLCDNSDLYENYYLSVESVRFMAPVVNLVYKIAVFVEGTKFSWLFATLSSIVMYAGAMVLNKFRKSELSGNTVVWKPVFVVVKYAMIFSAALLGTWISYFISDQNIVTIFFGFLFGGLIGLVLMNSIMYRSTRAMFKDFKKFLICMGIALAFIVIVPLNATGLIGTSYRAGMTKSISLDVNEDVTFTDGDDIDTILSLDRLHSYVDLRSVRFVYSDDPETMKKLAYDFGEYVYKDNIPAGNGYYTSYGEYYDEYGVRVFEMDREPEASAYGISKAQAMYHSTYYTNDVKSVTMVQKPYFGVPLAKRIQVDVNSTAFDKLINSEEYIAQYNMPELLKDSSLNMLDFNILGYSEQLVSAYREFDFEDFENVISECVFDPAKRDSSVLIGWLNFHSVDTNNKFVGNYMYFPVYSCDVKLLNALSNVLDNADEDYFYESKFLYEKYGEMVYEYSSSVAAREECVEAFGKFNSEKDVLNYLSEQIESVALVNAITFEAVIVDNKADIYKLLDASSSICDDKWSVMEFSKAASTDYILLVDYGYNHDREVYFRPDALSYAELEAIFTSNK